MSAQELLSVQELAELVDRDESSITRLARAGKIPGAVRIGGSWGFRREDVEAWEPPKRRGTRWGAAPEAEHEPEDDGPRM